MRESGSRRIGLVSILCALAIALGVAECMLPVPYGIPGIKLGLGNVAILLTLYGVDAKASFTVLIIKIMVSALYSGSMLSLAYSVGGGFLSFLVMLLLSKLLPHDCIWVVSVFGSVIHIVTQVLIASVVMNSTSVLLLLTVYVPTSVIAGVFTGLCSTFVLKIIKKYRKN